MEDSDGLYHSVSTTIPLPSKKDGCVPWTTVIPMDKDDKDFIETITPWNNPRKNETYIPLPSRMEDDIPWLNNGVPIIDNNDIFETITPLKYEILRKIPPRKLKYHEEYVATFTPGKHKFQAKSVTGITPRKNEYHGVPKENAEELLQRLLHGKMSITTAFPRNVAFTFHSHSHLGWKTTFPGLITAFQRKMPRN